MAEAKIDKTKATDYETVFILRGDIDAETSEKVISRVISAIESSGGKLTKVESWGKRRLAYPIGKQRKGFYVYMRYLGYRGVVTELERNLRMQDTVLRHMSIQIATGIDPVHIQVDPEEVKIRRIEISPEEEDREESVEAQLGLADEAPPPRPPEAPPPEETSEAATPPDGGVKSEPPKSPVGEA